MSSHPFRFRPHVFLLRQGAAGTGERGLVEALACLRARRLPLLLDSASGSPRRFSLLAFDPVATTILGVDGRHMNAESALEAARESWASLVAEPTSGSSAQEVPGPFAGGWVGALAYDLGVAGEGLELPSEPWRQPLLVGGLYTDFLVRDEVDARAWLVLGEDPGDERPCVEDRRRELEVSLLAPREPIDCGAGGPVAGAERSTLVRCIPVAEHCARIERAREWIAAGELYQANLAHRFTRTTPADPLALYRSLRACNPAPYMAYLDWSSEAEANGIERGALLSSSPELLFEFDGECARTRPIKGTAPRAADPEADRRAGEALLASGKDLAELGMIVDLERNDLGRVARPGGVRVEGYPTLESYAAVHHLVADVVATTQDGTDAFDALAALFPGGSITGAPKLRSMEAIAELEGEGRGFFTGSLGFVDLRGRAVFNILIRTLLWRPGEVSYRVGGGITWSSDAAAEDRETLHKGAPLAAALEALEPPAEPARSGP